MAHRLLEFAERYAKCFSSTRPGIAGRLLKRAKEYVNGLLVADKGNMLRMEEAVSDSDEQALQHFLATSEWDEGAILRQVSRDVDRHLGGQADSCLILDETGFPKKGDHSVGVARQWCGQIGKVDNCQVAVFGVLSCGEKAAPVGMRLYLPKEWIDDPKRCRRAGIPRAQCRQVRSKHELGLEIVDSARQSGVRYGWIGCDAFYGKNPVFLRALQQRGETFVADIHKDQIVFLEDPSTQSNSVRGVRVDDWMLRRAASAWKRVEVRNTTKGTLQIEILHQVVWLWDRLEATAQKWRLLIRREVATQDKISYVVSNAGPDVTAKRLAYMQAQRYWVERAFQDAKTEAGLGDYQVRGWKPWHRHMALVAMAMAFLLEERLAHQETYPLLSCRDVTALLKQVIRTRQTTEETLMRQMEKRHRQRQNSIDSALLRQQLSSRQ